MTYLNIFTYGPRELGKDSSHVQSWLPDIVKLHVTFENIKIYILIEFSVMDYYNTLSYIRFVARNIFLFN